MRDELAGLIAASPDFESKLDALRAFRHQEFLRIAIADLAGDLELFEVERELTTLAETVLDEAMALARIQTEARFAIPATMRLCAIAMGRLGAGEMSYNSDLDLIFVYDDRAEVAAGSREIASRITQKLIAILESRTREGYAYKLDLRLRPSGNAGPAGHVAGGLSRVSSAEFRGVGTAGAGARARDNRRRASWRAKSKRRARNSCTAAG